MRHAIKVMLTDDEIRLFNQTAKTKTAILPAGAEKENQEIVKEVGICSHSVAVWRNRFATERLKGLMNHPRKYTPIKYTAEDRRRAVEMACAE